MNNLKSIAVTNNVIVCEKPSIIEPEGAKYCIERFLAEEGGQTKGLLFSKYELEQVGQAIKEILKDDNLCQCGSCTCNDRG